MNLDTWTLDEPLYTSLVALTDLILKGVLILLGARIITLLMAKTAAAARHLVWTVALVMILMLPALSFVVPQIQLSLMDHPLQAQLSQPAQEMQASDPVASSGAPVDAWQASERSSGIASSMRTQDLAASPRSTMTEPGVRETPALVEAGGDLNKNIGFLASTLTLISNAHWTSLVMIIWSLGAVLTFGWILIGLSGAWWITRHAYAVESETWDDLNEELSDRLMVLRPVKLLMSASISSPMTWGIWRPVVLLPVDADDWSEERRRYVLLHELAHVKRWDTVTQLAAQLGCAVHWFNPLAWRSLYRMRMEQEKACDDLVLSHGMKASAYASHLLDIARSLKMPWTSPLNTISMAKPSQLEGRVVDILDPDKKQRSINRYSVVFTCFVAVALMLPVAALSPWRTIKPAMADAEYVLADASRQDAVRAWQLEQNTAALQHEQNMRENARVAVRTGSWKAEFDVAREAARAKARASASVTASIDAGDIAEAISAVRANAGNAVISFEGTHKPAAIDDIYFLPPGIYSAQPDTSEKQRQARKKAISALQKSLSDDNAEVRKFAAITLGEMQDRSSVVPLTKLLKNDANAEVRSAAIMALSEIDSPAALDAYLIALNDRDLEVRRFAVYALAERHEDEAMEALLSVLNDRDPEVRKYALMALSDHEIEEALPFIKKALKDSDVEVRRTAVIALSEFEDDDVIPLLRIALEDKDREVRRNALVALSDCVDEESMALFVNILLKDKDAEMRRYAAIALGDIGNVDATDALSRAMEDSDPEVRRQAAIALSQLDYGDRNSDWSRTQRSSGEWGAARVSDPADAEEFGASMARLGEAAGRLGIEAGAFSLGLTADILGSLARSGFDESKLEYELEAAGELFEAEMELAELKMEAELEMAEMKQEAEMELAEMKHELDMERLELEKELRKNKNGKQRREAEQELAALQREAEIELAAMQREAELELAAMQREVEIEMAQMAAELSLKRRQLAAAPGKPELQSFLDDIGFSADYSLDKNDAELKELMKALRELEGGYDEPDFCETLTSHLKEKNTRDARKLLRNMNCKD